MGAGWVERGREGIEPTYARRDTAFQGRERSADRSFRAQGDAHATMIAKGALRRALSPMDLITARMKGRMHPPESGIVEIGPGATPARMVAVQAMPTLHPLRSAVGLLSPPPCSQGPTLVYLYPHPTPPPRAASRTILDKKSLDDPCEQAQCGHRDREIRP
jgi:hypothetical protein